MSTVLEINEPRGLDAYRDVWNRKLPATPGATFFHSCDWLQAYWEHYGAGQKLRVLVVRGDSGVEGFLPLCVRTERFRVGPLRLLTYPLHDWGSYYGPIGCDPAHTLLAGLKHVRRTRRDWDLVDLRWIDLDGTDAGLTERTLKEAGFRPRKEPWAPVPVVALPRTWDAYLASRTSKWRNNYRRNERRLGELGEVTFQRYRPRGAAAGDSDPRWDLYRMCEEIAGQSWQAQTTDGTTLTHSAVGSFLRDAHARAAALGMLDMNLLLVEGEPAAFAYNYHFQGSVQGLRVGFDARFAQAGCGNVLYARVLRDSIERDDRRYDLGAGSVYCKRFFYTHVEASYRYLHLPLLSPRAQALGAKHALRDWWFGPNHCLDLFESTAPKEAEAAV